MEENKEMTFGEALALIIDNVTDVEGLEDAFDVIKNTANADSEYKTKYEDLKEKYKKRFKEEITSTPEPREIKNEKKESYTVEQLDFSGKTE